jgi:hypothetical protein
MVLVVEGGGGGVVVLVVVLQKDKSTVAAEENKLAMDIDEVAVVELDASHVAMMARSAKSRSRNRGRLLLVAFFGCWADSGGGRLWCWWSDGWSGGGIAPGGDAIMGH